CGLSLLRRCYLPLRLFFKAAAAADLYTLSLHDALPICVISSGCPRRSSPLGDGVFIQPSLMQYSSTLVRSFPFNRMPTLCSKIRSEEHTSELQSRENLVCRLLLEKKKSRHGRGARSSRV